MTVSRFFCALESRVLLAFGNDLTWGDAGVVKLDQLFLNNFPALLHVQSDQKVISGGLGSLPGDAAGTRVLGAVRLNADGSVDTTFGTGGVVAITTGRATGMQVGDDGEILLAMNNAPQQPLEEFVEARKPDGSIDAGYATGGHFVLPPAADDNFQGALRIALGPDGDLYAATADYNVPSEDQTAFQSHTRVVKLNPDGSADAAFNNGGVVTYAAGPFRSFDVNQAIVQPDGHLILQNNGQVDRIAPNGDVEQSFIADGTYTRNSIAIQPDGKILIADAVSLDNDQIASVSRFNADGSPDTSYGDSGRAHTGTLDILASPSSVQAFTVDLQGRAVLAIGSTEPEVPTLMVRWNPDGSVDTTLDPTDALSLDMGSAESIDVQADGKVLLGGNLFAVARVTDVLEDVALLGGVLSVRGTSGADTIIVTSSGSNIVLTRNGTQTTYAASQVQKINVDALAGNDTISVSVDLPATINGRAGNDKITTADGHDNITSGDGNDTIFTGNGGDRVDGDAGDDSITCGDAGVIDGIPFGHVISGGDGDDTIVTGSGEDSIHGNAGDDEITVGAGYDSINAEDGDNLIHAVFGDVICDFGNDTIIGGDATDNPGGVFQFDIHSGGGNDSIITGDGNDIIQSGSGTVTISSGGGNDIIRADGDSSSRVDSGAGDDTIECGSAATINGGAGNDQVSLESGKTIDGGDGNDAITVRAFILDGIDAGAGDDLVRCNSDADHGAVIHGGDGDDNLFAGDGRDSIYGGAGRDRIHAGNGGDLLSGGGGRDHLFGQGGNDRLYGGRGNDRMDGQGGNDRFRGDAGADRINGGAGDSNTVLDQDDDDELSNIKNILP